MTQPSSSNRKPVEEMNPHEREVEKIRLLREILDKLDRMHEMQRRAVIGSFP